jgi:hypothetical protein
MINFGIDALDFGTESFFGQNVPDKSLEYLTKRLKE